MPLNTEHVVSVSLPLKHVSRCKRLRVKVVTSRPTHTSDPERNLLCCSELVGLALHTHQAVEHGLGRYGILQNYRPVVCGSRRICPVPIIRKKPKSTSRTTTITEVCSRIEYWYYQQIEWIPSYGSTTAGSIRFKSSRQTGRTPRQGTLWRKTWVFLLRSPKGSTKSKGSLLRYAYQFQLCGSERSTAASPAGSDDIHRPSAGRYLR